MSRRLCLAFLAAAVLLAVFAAGAAGAARFYTPVYGGTEPEVIGGFDLGSDGSLAPIPGSPFPASEPGFGGLTGLAFTLDGTRAASAYLFNGGVQGYAVPSGGIFQLTGARLTASATSIAISPDGRFAFAPTREFKSVPAEGVRRFAINSDGTLGALMPSGGSGQYADVALTPDGRFLFATTGAQIERFAVGADGSLNSLGMTPAPGSYLLATAPDGRHLFALFAGGSSSGFTSFAIAADGGLQRAGDPALIADSFPRLFAMAPDGRRLYLTDTNKNAIQVFAIAADGAPSVVGSMPVKVPESAGVSPDGRYLVYFHRGDANALAVAAIGADGIPAPLGREIPWDTGEPQPIVFQPHPAPIASFVVKPGAPGAAARFDAGGSVRAARYDWDFGDGTKLADGGPNPRHVYAKAGAYRVSLTVTDASGCSAANIYDGHSTVCPGGASAVANGSVDTLPALSNLKAKPKKFRAKPKGKAKGKFGTTLRYRLTEAASVRFTIERKLKKKGKRVRFKRVGFLPQKAKAGANKLKWNGRLKRKPLAAGSYRATAVATDKAGGRSAAKKIGFRVLPLP
ncbi:MAG TPA: PKD domain-containing protein [Solirubrobacterales bacterium]|nr:PKD domain-containing protein [Solirubrobacterales bacterium]